MSKRHTDHGVISPVKCEKLGAFGRHKVEHHGRPQSEAQQKHAKESAQKLTRILAEQRATLSVGTEVEPLYRNVPQPATLSGLSSTDFDARLAVTPEKSLPERRTRRARSGPCSSGTQAQANAGASEMMSSTGQSQKDVALRISVLRHKTGTVRSNLIGGLDLAETMVHMGQHGAYESRFARPELNTCLGISRHLQDVKLSEFDVEEALESLHLSEREKHSLLHQPSKKVNQTGTQYSGLIDLRVDTPELLRHVPRLKKTTGSRGRAATQADEPKPDLAEFLQVSSGFYRESPDLTFRPTTRKTGKPMTVAKRMSQLQSVPLDHALEHYNDVLLWSETGDTS